MITQDIKYTKIRNRKRSKIIKQFGHRIDEDQAENRKKITWQFGYRISGD